MAGVRKRLISQEVSVTTSTPQDDVITSNEDIIYLIEEVQLEAQQEASCSRLSRIDRSITKTLSVRELLQNTDSANSLLLLIHCTFCEMTGSLLFLLPVNLLFILAAPQIRYFTFYLNLLNAQLFDGVVKILVKAAVSRKSSEELKLEFPGITNFSFPSGHCSRMCMLGYIFLRCSNESMGLCLIVIISVITVSLSRVMLGRHFVSDMLGGIVVGALNGVMFVECLWVTEQSLEDIYAIRTGAANWIYNMFHVLL